METIDELRAFLENATQDGARGRILARGAAWALMRREGGLPDDAPAFGSTIETDLADFSLATLRATMALRRAEGSSALTTKAFEQAAKGFEAIVRNGDPTAPDRGFRRTLAASAYHLAGYSAVAFSLFNETQGDLNLAPGESAIRSLILRDLDGLRRFVRDWLTDPEHTDEKVAVALEGDDGDIDEAIALILNTTICRALAGC